MQIIDIEVDILDKHIKFIKALIVIFAAVIESIFENRIELLTRFVLFSRFKDRPALERDITSSLSLTLTNVSFFSL